MEGSHEIGEGEVWLRGILTKNYIQMLPDLVSVAELPETLLEWRENLPLWYEDRLGGLLRAVPVRTRRDIHRLVQTMNTEFLLCIHEIRRAVETAAEAEVSPEVKMVTIIIYVTMCCMTKSVQDATSLIRHVARHLNRNDNAAARAWAQTMNEAV